MNSQPDVPTKGQRNSQKILGAVCPVTGQFAYRHQTEYFNAETYLAFVQEVLLPAFRPRGRRVYLIQDNASYHKKPDVWAWFSANRSKIEVFQLPPYSPEFNATERMWRYTRQTATHNRYFDTPEELCSTLFSAFDTFKDDPDPIKSLLRSFS